MKLASVAIFAAGYVFGTRAGRERYTQIVDLVERTSERLEAFSSRPTPDRQGESPGGAEGGT